jgi:hypothetical protein
MRNKFETNRGEVLSLHKKNKTKGMILREQSGDLKSQLQSMIDNGEVTDVVGIAELDTTNQNRRFAIKKKSKKNPGTFVYLFSDKKYGSFGPDGKFTYGDGVWIPKESTAKVVDRGFKDAEIDSYKKKYGAKTKEEAIKSGWDLTNLKKVNVQGVDLFIPMSSSNVVTGVSQKQKEALADMKRQYGAKEWDEMTGSEQYNWKEWDIPNSERLFGTQVKLYRPQQQDMKLDTKDFDTFSQDYNLDEKTCSNYILKYFDDYRTDRPVPQSYFDNLKPKVQFCKNKFHNRWGIRANSRKLNKILDLMSRQISEFQGANLPPSFPVEGSNRHQWLLKNI